MADARHFDRVATDYDAVRPGYPARLVERALQGAAPGAAVLELGCGSGQLTRSLVGRGLVVHAVDIGHDLVALARRNLEGASDVTLECGDLRSWRPDRVYDVVLAGTAFHWLPADQGLRLAADALRPGGRLSLLRHEHPLPVSGFHRRAQSVYRSVFPEGRGIDTMPADPERIAAVARRFALEPRFGPVTVHAERWSRRYTRDDYLRLLRTYSDQGSLSAERWEQLVTGLAAIIDGEYGGSVDRPYLTVLWSAKRR